MRSLSPLMFALALAGASSLSSPAMASAQEGPGPGPRVYFDCRSSQCDMSYYRTEIDWVYWVRDQADADVYVIMTSQSNGGGGREYVFDFTGRGPNSDYRSGVRYRALATDTERESLDGLALTLGLGLAQFATQSGFRDLVALDGLYLDEEGVPSGLVAASQVDDPWDLWVFRISGNGNYDGQSSRREWRLNTNLNVDRVTPTWKQSYRANYSKRSQTIEFDTRPDVIDDRFDWGVNWRVVYALAEHFSAGVSGNVGRNTTNNQDIWGQFNPAIEWSYFPYEEATRRSLTVFYEIGPVYRSYFEPTLYGLDSELRVEEALSISLQQRQPWGGAGVNVRGSNYMHDVHINNLSVNGNVSLRIVRGLDLNMGASYSRVRDQIYLRGGSLTEEERLLRLQQEATAYRAQMNFGLSYQFGSPFNNVVNNRM